MSYNQNNGRKDRDQYEQWMHHGRERGWLEQGTDEVRSWFGDDEAEHRRSMDNRAERLRSNTNMDNEFERGANRMPGVNYDRMHGGQVTRYNQNMIDQNRNYNFDRTTKSSIAGQWPWSSDDGYQTFGRTGVDSKFGRGPKDYKRSDERISEEIHECFSRHHELDATEIQIEVKNGEVTIRGTVDQRFEKRIAEDLVDEVSGVKHVQNMIRINERMRNERTGQETRTPEMKTGMLSGNNR